MYKTLEEIPGVGKVIADKLISYFGSEEDAINSILEANVAEIASIEGIGPRKAFSIVKSALEDMYGVKVSDLIKTEDLMRMYERILEIIRRYAKTDYAKYKLSLLYPLPSRKADLIMERLNYFKDAKYVVSEVISKDDLSRISELLKSIKPLKRKTKPPKILERVVLTSDKRMFDKFIEMGLDRMVNVDYVEEPRLLADYCKGYAVVLFVSGGEMDWDIDYGSLENLKIIEGIDVEEIVPEVNLSFYSKNLEVIRAVCELCKILKKYSENEVIAKIVGDIDFEAMEKVEDKILLMDENMNLVEGFDEELDRYRETAEKAEEVVLDLEIKINEKIKKRLEESTLVLNGKKIIELLERSSEKSVGMDELRSYLPDEVVDLFISTVDEAENELFNRLKLDVSEVSLIENMFPRNASLPVEADRKKMSDLIEYLKNKYNLRKYEILVNLSKELKEYTKDVIKSIQSILEFDLFLTIGLFSLDYELNVPKIYTSYLGVGFKNAKNLFLREKEIRGEVKVQPVSYVVGKVPIEFEGTKGERIILLSGANSGGKTSLLQTMMQIVLLGQMGLPVPAEEAHIGLFEELYYYEKARGVLDAGAFEASLLRIAEIVISKAPKLACFDEWEASTEANAAAKIISSILELFEGNENSCVVFVSHLAEEISKTTGASIRVDGIEARGLDERMNLIVDRSPKFNYLAKSMPELIVQRLSKISKGEYREVFDKILTNFE
ncbi:MAG: MutS-related protein [Candidatus Asgardarchaeia archaeon]